VGQHVRGRDRVVEGLVGAGEVDAEERAAVAEGVVGQRQVTVRHLPGAHAAGERAGLDARPGGVGVEEAAVELGEAVRDRDPEPCSKGALSVLGQAPEIHRL
jgi:hypothetical protein